MLEIQCNIRYRQISLSKDGHNRHQKWTADSAYAQSIILASQDRARDRLETNGDLKVVSDDLEGSGTRVLAVL